MCELAVHVAQPLGSVQGAARVSHRARQLLNAMSRLCPRPEAPRAVPADSFY